MTYFKHFMLATLMMGCSHALWADDAPVVLRDDVVTLPQTVVVEGDDISHFRNVELTQESDGSFAITASEPGSLASVDSVDVLRDDDRVAVLSRGFRSSCVSIQEEAVTYHEGEFIVAIPESEPVSDVCIAVAVEYYLITPLPTVGMESGEYTVNVNGVKANFTL